MIKKFIYWTLFLVVTSVALYVFIGAMNIKFTGNVKLEGKDISVEYSVRNESIAELTIPRNKEKNLSVNYRIFDENKVLLADSNADKKISTDKKVLKKGESMAARFFVEKDARAKYIQLYIEPQKNLCETDEEKFITFFRKGKIKTPKIEIK